MNSCRYNLPHTDLDVNRSFLSNLRTHFWDAYRPSSRFFADPNPLAYSNPYSTARDFEKISCIQKCHVIGMTILVGILTFGVAAVPTLRVQIRRFRLIQKKEKEIEKEREMRNSPYSPRWGIKQCAEIRINQANGRNASNRADTLPPIHRQDEPPPSSLQDNHPPVVDSARRALETATIPKTCAPTLQLRQDAAGTTQVVGDQWGGFVIQHGDGSIHLYEEGHHHSYKIDDGQGEKRIDYKARLKSHPKSTHTQQSHGGNVVLFPSKDPSKGSMYWNWNWKGREGGAMSHGDQLYDKNHIKIDSRKRGYHPIDVAHYLLDNTREDYIEPEAIILTTGRGHKHDFDNDIREHPRNGEVRGIIIIQDEERKKIEQMCQERGIKLFICTTGKGIDLSNELSAAGVKVGACLHGTC